MVDSEPAQDKASPSSDDGGLKSVTRTPNNNITANLFRALHFQVELVKNRYNCSSRCPNHTNRHDVVIAHRTKQSEK
jgi:hypothetical protein